MRRSLFCLLLFFYLYTFFVTPHANSQQNSVKVTVISIPGLTFNHIYEVRYPHLRRLLEEGSVGAMNLRTAGADTLANSYATLAVGRRVSVPQQHPFYHAHEELQDRSASDWVKERLGVDVKTGVVYPWLAPFEQKNSTGEATIVHMLLGDVLHEAGIRTAVWGNADWGEEDVRFAPFLTMDRYGRTAEGDINNKLVTQSADRPFGIKTNYGALLERKQASDAAFQVLELGDLYRLEQESEFMTKQRSDEVERVIIQEIDQFLGDVLSSLTDGELLWLISPHLPATKSTDNVQLAPVIHFQADSEGGLLYSPTTRRSGIVANVDFAPTVLQSFGITPPNRADGQPIEVVDGDVDTFWKTMDQVKTVYAMRPPVIYVYALYQVTTLIIALGLLISKKKRRTEFLQIALLASVLTPVLFLLLAPVPALSTGLFLLLLIVFAFLSAFLLKKLPTVPLFFIVGAIGFVPVLLDGLFGGHLIRQSFLGYDAIIGARYYGIGNEYMGVVLGAVFLMIAAGLEWVQSIKRWMKITIALLFVLLVLYFAAPFWGTNAGGALAASVGFAVAYVRFFHSHRNLQFWLVFTGLGFVGIGLLFVMNVLFAVDAPSHIGRAFDHLMAGDFAEIVAIAKRKLATNIRLIKASLWGKVFFISLLAMTVLIIQPLRGVRWLQMRYPYLFHGFTAILITALSALVFNDSGIVSAATAIVYVVIPLLIIVCRDWTAKPD